MKSVWKWVLGIGAALLVLFLLQLGWWMFMPFGRYGGMMGYGGYPMMGGWHMPMMYGGSFGLGMIFTGLVQLGLLVLIGLGIAALIKFLTSPGSH